MRRLSIAILLVGSFQLVAEKAHSATTDWMPPAQFQRYLQKLKTQNRIPTKIECKGTNSSSRNNFARFRLTDTPNKKKKPWLSQVNKFSNVTVTAGQRRLDKLRGLRRKVVSYQRFSVPGHTGAYTCHITHFDQY